MLDDNEKNILGALKKRPVRWRPRGGKPALALFAVAMAVLFGVGGAAGGLLARWQAQTAAAEDWQRLQTALAPVDIRRAVTAIEQRVNDTPQMRCLLAMVYILAAEKLPEAAHFHQKALAECEFAASAFAEERNKKSAAPDSARRFLGNFSSVKTSPLFDECQLLLAGELAENGRWAQALALAENLDEQAAGRDAEWEARVLNLRAYLLAMAVLRGEKKAETSARRALDMAEKVVFQMNNQNNAAYLDTLAMALLANGRTEAAWETERRAWGMAPAGQLWNYQDNYRRITARRQVAPGGKPQTVTLNKEKKP